MTNKIDNLERMILQAVADDYEEIEMIVGDIRSWTKTATDAPNVVQIEHALAKAVAEKNVNAYEYSATHHFVTTKINSADLRRFWFYITEQGIKRLETLDARLPTI
jgi:hypothetical protein